MLIMVHIRKKKTKQILYFRARQNGGAACQANRALWAHLYQHTSTIPTLGESDVLP